VLLQSLPCIVAAHALTPLQPGSRVLDMCAAPGGKATMLAQLMAGDSSSELVALDRTQAKVARVQQLSQLWGVQRIVQPMAADATQLYQPLQPEGGRQQQQRRQRPLSAAVLAAVAPESFDAVLLDAPCSALGLRPRLLLDWRLQQLQALAAYQRALLHAAVHVLKPGGCLVFCTCTINPGELVGGAGADAAGGSSSGVRHAPCVGLHVMTPRPSAARR
jgi:16S rRNA C967 or C1407 C5-methylase (RsmB/RsmF family)